MNIVYDSRYFLDDGTLIIDIRDVITGDLLDRIECNDGDNDDELYTFLCQKFDYIPEDSSQSVEQLFYIIDRLMDCPDIRIDSIKLYRDIETFDITRYYRRWYPVEERTNLFVNTCEVITTTHLAIDDETQVTVRIQTNTGYRILNFILA